MNPEKCNLYNFLRHGSGEGAGIPTGLAPQSKASERSSCFGLVKIVLGLNNYAWKHCLGGALRDSGTSASTLFLHSMSGFGFRVSDPATILWLVEPLVRLLGLSGRKAVLFAKPIWAFSSFRSGNACNVWHRGRQSFPLWPRSHHDRICIPGQTEIETPCPQKQVFNSCLRFSTFQLLWTCCLFARFGWQPNILGLNPSSEYSPNPWIVYAVSISCLHCPGGRTGASLIPVAAVGFSVSRSA